MSGMMRDLLFLVPALAGVGVIALGAKYADTVVERPGSGVVMGGALILAALFWWWASALVLVWEGKSFVLLDMLMFCFLFWGLMCLPRVRPGTKAGGVRKRFWRRRGKDAEEDYDFRPRPERPGRGVVVAPERVASPGKGKTGEGWQLAWGVMLLGGGFVLGLAHSLVVTFSGPYRDGLLGFYGKLGMTERKPGLEAREKRRAAPKVTPYRFPTPTPLRTPPPFRVPAKGEE